MHIVPPIDRHAGGVVARRGNATVCLSVAECVPDDEGNRQQRRAWKREHPDTTEPDGLPCLGGFTVAHKERRCDCYTERVH